MCRICFIIHLVALVYGNIFVCRNFGQNGDKCTHRRLPHHWWSLPLIGEEEYDGCGGVSLGAPLWVALLSVPSSSGSVRNGMIYVGSFFPSPSRIQPYPLYIEIGGYMVVWGVKPMVYMR
jgi:hypothetical protein